MATKHPGAMNDDSPTASREVQHKNIIKQLNQIPKFTAEWFRLKEEEIHLCDYLASNGSISTEITKSINKSPANEEVESHAHSAQLLK